MNLSRLISILHNQKNSYMNVQLKEFGLSHGQAITLKIIYEENNIKQEDLNKTLELQINKVNTQFNSISLGSNINYLDYIKNTLGCIMKFLRDKSNDSMAFAKNSMKTREDIEKLIADSYKITMKDYGENLTENFKIRIGNNIDKEKTYSI